MKPYRILLAALVLAMIGAVPAGAQQFNNAGTSVANFLKIPVGPRGTALGGAFTALVDDASSLYWNIAGMNGVQGNEVMFVHNEWLLDLTHEYVAGVFSVGEFSRLGLSVSYLSYGDMEETTVAQPAGTGLFFSAYDVAIGVAFSRQLTDRFALGVQSKFVRESIAKSAAGGIAFDVGLLFKGDWRGLRIGAAINNFGPDLQMTGDNLRTKLDPYPGTGNNPEDVPLFLETESFSLPITFQFGVSLVPYETETLSVTTMLDVRDSRDFNQEIRFGTELKVMSSFYLRGGTSLIVIEGNPFGGGDDVIIDSGSAAGGNTGLGPAYVNPSSITRDEMRDGQASYNLGAGIDYVLENSGLGFRFDYAYSRILTLNDVHRFGIALSF